MVHTPDTSSFLPAPEPDRRVSLGDAVVHGNTIYKDSIAIPYQTVQPAPTQWVATAVVPVRAGGPDQVEVTHRMLVGTGVTEAGAIEALRVRLAQLPGTAVGMPPTASEIALEAPEHL